MGNDIEFTLSIESKIKKNLISYVESQNCLVKLASLADLPLSVISANNIRKKGAMYVLELYSSTRGYDNSEYIQDALSDFETFSEVKINYFFKDDFSCCLYQNGMSIDNIYDKLEEIEDEELRGEVKDLILSDPIDNIERLFEILFTEDNVYRKIFEAIRWHNFEVVKQLMERIRCDKSVPLLANAVSNKCSKEMVALLIKNNADIEAYDYNSKKAIHYAIKNDRIEIVKLLLSSGASLTCMDEDMNSCLHICVKIGTLKMFKLLLKTGIDVNCKNGDGDTPLHLAIEVGNVELAKELILNEADINITNRAGNTPLHLSSMENNYDISELLINMGANVNSTNNEGEAPLHSYIRYKCYKNIEILNKVGVDPDFLISKMESVESIVEKFLNLPISCLGINKVIVNKLKEDYVENIEELINSRYSKFDAEDLIDIKYHLSAWNLRVGINKKDAMKLWGSKITGASQTDFIKLFIGNGAYINAVTNQKDSMLHYAAKNGNIEIMKFLIENGANKNPINDTGATLLHSFVSSKSSDPAVIIQFLKLHSMGIRSIYVSTEDKPYNRNDAIILPDPSGEDYLTTKSALLTITPREAEILIKRYLDQGVYSNDESYKRVANYYTLTVERVKQIERKGFRRLYHTKRHIEPVDTNVIEVMNFFISLGIDVSKKDSNEKTAEEIGQLCLEPVIFSV